eukprot:scaffold2929_cov138-Skeletonema_marinoi.AAC.5
MKRCAHESRWRGGVTLAFLLYYQDQQEIKVVSTLENKDVVEGGEERSVGTPLQSKHHVSESTGSVPTPQPTPPTFSFGTASYAKSADLAVPGPTTATASSASNPFNSFN